MALLHAAGFWTPQALGDKSSGDQRPLFVSLLVTPAAEAASDGAKHGTGVPFPPAPSVLPVSPRKASLPTEASLSPQAPTRGASLPGEVEGLRFYTSAEVDRQALPASTLELLEVMGLVTDPSSMMLRVYIDRDGAVVRAEIIRASEGNRVAAARLALVLMETRFVPAKRLGMDVAAMRDLEFQIEPPEKR
ncbi:energy transducer TonB [Ralstonia psammae]|uniref:energy transducer TonB n=1 Tax=Ralstonia psammae TaxID=3058598 RepID=UPI00292F91C0|nr:hypothetical protein [Ralstonia sp. LMG 19083]